MKLKAATMIESVLAMIIIVVCLSIGTMIYSNVLNSDQERIRLKTTLIFKQELFSIKESRQFLDSEKRIGQWLLETRFEKYENTENLYQLKLRLTDQEKTIGEHNELIIAAE